VSTTQIEDLTYFLNKYDIPHSAFRHLTPHQAEVINALQHTKRPDIQFLLGETANLLKKIEAGEKEKEKLVSYIKALSFYYLEKKFRVFALGISIAAFITLIATLASIPVNPIVVVLLMLALILYLCLVNNPKGK